MSVNAQLYIQMTVCVCVCVCVCKCVCKRVCVYVCVIKGAYPCKLCHKWVARLPEGTASFTANHQSTLFASSIMADDLVVADGDVCGRSSFAGCEMSDLKYVQARLETFKTWPKQMRPNKYELASAGFVYSGEGDRVKCFYCKVQLHNWEMSDNAWKEHYRWQQNNCEFIRLCYTAERKERPLM